MPAVALKERKEIAMSALIRLFKYVQTLTAGALATTTITNPSTLLNVVMTGATGVQTVVLPSANMYVGEVCIVSVSGAVATHTVDVKSTSGGSNIDQFAASTNGSRMYGWNGTAWQPVSDPS